MIAPRQGRHNHYERRSHLRWSARAKPVARKVRGLLPGFLPSDLASSWRLSSCETAGLIFGRPLLGWWRVLGGDDESVEVENNERGVP